MKKKIQIVKEFLEKPMGKTIAFFGFYFLFFLVILFMFQFGGRNYTKIEDYEKGNSLSFYVDSLNRQNYAFAYTVTVDQKTYEYYGQRNGNILYFEYDNQPYYYDGVHYYKQDSEWVECENPFVYPELLEVSNVMTLVEASSYESRTTYDSGKVNYNYLLSSNTINSLIYRIDSDFLEEPNSLVIGVNEKREVNQIMFHLNSFGSLNHISNQTFKINLEFDLFGEVKEIANPLI